MSDEVERIKAELKEAQAEAQAQANAAADRLVALRRLLHETIARESGVLGHVLEFTRRLGGRPQKVITKRLLVEAVVEHWSGAKEARGRGVNATGKLGARTEWCLVEEAVDLGPAETFFAKAGAKP